jgi:hypothetical protein
MTDTLKAVEINCETGVVTERFLTDEEMAQREIDAAAQAVAEAERQAAADALAALKVSARAKLVAGTPLTEEEAAVLVI